LNNSLTIWARFNRACSISH